MKKYIIKKITSIFSKGFITCGSDGDVRYWLNLMDDDPSASCVSEQAISVVSKVYTCIK